MLSLSTRSSRLRTAGLRSGSESLPSWRRSSRVAVADDRDVSAVSSRLCRVCLGEFAGMGTVGRFDVPGLLRVRRSM